MATALSSPVCVRREDIHQVLRRMVVCLRQCNQCTWTRTRVWQNHSLRPFMPYHLTIDNRQLALGAYGTMRGDAYTDGVLSGLTGIRQGMASRWQRGRRGVHRHPILPGTLAGLDPIGSRGSSLLLLPHVFRISSSCKSWVLRGRPMGSCKGIRGIDVKCIRVKWKCSHHCVDPQKC